MKKYTGLLIFFCLLGCSSQIPKKINGVSFVASREVALQPHIDALMNVKATYAAVMPFGFIREPSSPDIIFDTERQWYGETRKGAAQYIELLHRNGLKVMVKPQIWISGGVFTGTMKMNSEADWQQLEDSYEAFILAYTDLASETGAELLCIGTELEQFVTHRPEFWTRLIAKIKDRYKGKLTYAANWDEYPKTPFWEELHYIGIDAYFPLSEEKTPTVEELKAGWQPWKSKIKSLSSKVGKQVLFTEFGYRSMDYTAHKPWLVDRTEEGINMEGQVNAKKAIFETFWAEDWFAGGFVWKWFIDHEKAGGERDNRFTPQNKPAEAVIKSYYSSF